MGIELWGKVPLMLILCRGLTRKEEGRVIKHDTNAIRERRENSSEEKGDQGNRSHPYIRFAK